MTGADTLFMHLRDTMTWQHERRVMYEREVETAQTRSLAPPTVDPEVARLGALTRVGPGGYHESPPPAPLVAPGDVAGGAAQWRLGIVEGDR